MNDQPQRNEISPSDSQQNLSLSELSKKLQEQVREWGAILGPIVAAIAVALTSVFGMSNAIGQIVGWIVAVALLGIAIFVFHRRSVSEKERTNRARRVHEFEAGQTTRTSFRGLASFGRGDFLPGPQRRRDADTIFTQVSSEMFRFGIVSGDTGAGKSSLLRAELRKLLEKGGFSVAVLNSPRQLWLVTPEALDTAVAMAAMENWLSTAFSGKAAPHFTIIDQFEELFIQFPDGAERRSIGTFLNRLLRGPHPMRVLCGVRRDYFVDFRDLAPDLPEPISTQNTFLIRNFSRTEAEEVIRECAKRDGLQIPPELPEMIASDLAEQDQVRPAELQIVCTALRGDFGVQNYQISGGAATILSRHIAFAAETTANQALSNLVLRSLCDFVGNAKAPPATIEELAQRIGPNRDISKAPKTEIKAILEQFEAERLVVRTVAPDDTLQWSLIHDYLVEPVKIATQSASTRSEDAARILQAFLTESRANRKTTIPVGKLREITSFAPRDLLKAREAKRLIRRSYVSGYGRPAVLAVIVALLTGAAAAYSSTVSIWRNTGQARHWADNESGDIQPAILTTFTTPVVIYKDTEGFTDSANGATVWDALTGKELARIKDGIAIQGEEKLIVVHRNEKKVEIFDLAKRTSRQILIGDVDIPSASRLRAINDKYITFGLGDGQSTLMSIEDGKLFNFSPGSPSRIETRAVGQNDRVITFTHNVPGVWSLTKGDYLGALAKQQDGNTSWFEW